MTTRMVVTGGEHTLKQRITIEVSTLTDSEVEEAIECLLGLEAQTAKEQPGTRCRRRSRGR